MQIDSITIHNYRCIGKIKIDNLSPITLLVGRNNTGKSALIEAFALASAAYAGWRDCLGDDLITSIIERRGGWKYADMMIKIGEQKSEIYAKGEDLKGTVEITRSVDYLSEDIRSSVTLSFENYITEIIDKVHSYLERDEIIKPPRRIIELFYESIDINKIKVFIGYKDELTNKTTHAILIGDRPPFNFSMIDKGIRYLLPSHISTSKIIRSPSQIKSKTIFMLAPSIQYLNELQKRLAKSGELLNLIKILQEKISYFEDIREVGGNFLVFLKGFKTPIPLGSMGDGFRAQLAILAAISTVKNGIALMEEPEIRLHPGFMGTIANQIVNTAELENTQFIISTHSLDFLDFLIKANTELIKVIRMYLIEDATEIDYEILDGDEAVEELDELKMDLRGV